jgi:hypothetical protein
LSFANNRSLSLTDSGTPSNEFINTAFFPQFSNRTVAGQTNTFEFFGINGSIVVGPFQSIYGAGSSNSVINSAINLNLTNSAFSFSSMRITTSNILFLPSLTELNTYQFGAGYFASLGNVAIIDTPPVPLPAALPLFVASVRWDSWDGGRSGRR